jgi:hypothetical protein
MFHIGPHCVLFSCSTFFFDISAVIWARCSGSRTCMSRFGRCLWSVLFMYSTMLFSCFRVSGFGIGEAVLGLFAQDHGMVCLCDVVWVSYAFSVVRVCAGRVLMVGMVACHCCVDFPLVGRSAGGIWIAVRRCVRRMVLWFARHRCGPASLRARSPSHRRSHVSFGMSNTRC